MNFTVHLKIIYKTRIKNGFISLFNTLLVFTFFEELASILNPFSQISFLQIQTKTLAIKVVQFYQLENMSQLLRVLETAQNARFEILTRN
jgi:hypothetical protein